MIGTFSPDTDKPTLAINNTILWFEIPADCQGLVGEYLQAVIDGHHLPVARKFYSDRLRKQRSTDTQSFYPVSFNGELIVFYKLFDNWRVGSTTTRNTIADLGLKEAILQDISSVLAPA